MGKRAKRREIGRLLKLRGFPCKLYRGAKPRAFRWFSGRYLSECLRKLKYGPGDIVNDCDGQNHRISGYSHGVRGCIHSWGDWCGKSIAGYWFEHPQYAFEDGRWGCGCSSSPDPPLPRWKLERHWLEADRLGDGPGYEDSEMPWIHVWSKKELAESAKVWDGSSGWSERDAKILGHLQAGGHIYDDDGIYLSEWAPEGYKGPNVRIR